MFIITSKRFLYDWGDFQFFILFRFSNIFGDLKNPSYSENEFHVQHIFQI